VYERHGVRSRRQADDAGIGDAAERSDAPGADDRWLGRLVIHGDGAPRFVELPALAREPT
jgi:hypothetical protein